ncbi:MAG: hypothetical protein QXJ97_11890, partial [Desulfurococcaceae archaeon]
ILRVSSAPPIASSIVGAGELIGYTLRFIGALLTTYFGSSTSFWGLITLEYAFNVMVLPFLAFTNKWIIAVSLCLVERVKKGLRAPLRDVVLAEVTEDIVKGEGSRLFLCAGFLWVSHGCLELSVTLGFRGPRQTAGRGLRETAMTRPRET